VTSNLRVQAADVDLDGIVGRLNPIDSQDQDLLAHYAKPEMVFESP
jgi:hypothetical protein